MSTSTLTLAQPAHSSPRTSKSPIPDERFVPVSSVKMPAKSHRPSLSGPMNWLGRSSSSSSTSSYTPSKPIRISEPFGTSAFDRLTRSGQLGAGATVVRTPQDALAPRQRSTDKKERIEEEEEEDRAEGSSRAGSPPLPPLPMPAEDIDDDETLVNASSVGTPPCPTRKPPSAPVQEGEESPTTPSASSSPRRNRSMRMLDDFPPVPALPANLPASPPQAPFEPILLSAAPSGAIDPNKIIVSLETSTTTYKATMNTLRSRASFLATYLSSLLPAQEGDEDQEAGSRLSDAESSFHSIFHNHLASSGLISASATTIHVFLDRPSAPYAHILSYLRTPVSTPEHPAALPRAVQLISSSSARLEALLELRDEARYLDLDELYKLCTDELRARHNLGLGRMSMHHRAMSNTSSNSMSTSSVRSLGLGTLREDLHEFESEKFATTKAKRLSRDSGLGSSSHSVPSPRSSVVAEVGWQPTPQVSAGLAQRGRSRPKKASSMRGRPTGDWI